MFELIQIQLLGEQPAAKVSQQLLKKIIHRDFECHENEVEQKLKAVHSDTLKGKLRISAAILRLANKDFNALGELIVASNNDFRDIITQAEYPKNYVIGLEFEELTKTEIKKMYRDDWKEYSNWLYKE